MLKPNLDKVNHVYTYEGRKLPSVSEIMKPHYNKLYESVPEKYMRVAGQRGSEIHENIEYILLFDVDIPRWEGFNKAFRAWLNFVGFQYEHIELSLTDGFFCGTFDLYGTINGEKWLIDVKTTYTLHRKSVAIQLSAYDYLCKANGLDVERHGVLLLKDNEYKWYDDIQPDTEGWQELLYEFRTNKGNQYQEEY